MMSSYIEYLIANRFNKLSFKQCIYKLKIKGNMPKPDIATAVSLIKWHNTDF